MVQLREKENKRNIDDFSVGVDIESIRRFKNLDRKRSKAFLSKIFLRNEIDYCFSKKNPTQHLAVRFTAKEAVIKAVASLGKEPPAFNKIQIKNNAKGAPSVELRGYNVKISMSHCDDKAIAFAVVLKK
jgi:holo-[acyl-carrier protein] synthase